MAWHDAAKRGWRSEALLSVSLHDDSRTCTRAGKNGNASRAAHATHVLKGGVARSAGGAGVASGEKGHGHG